MDRRSQAEIQDLSFLAEQRMFLDFSSFSQCLICCSTGNILELKYENTSEYKTDVLFVYPLLFSLP